MAGILQYVPGVSNFAPVNKAWKYLAAVLFLLLSLAGTAAGQNHVRRAMDRARVQRESMAAREILSEMGAGKSGYMAYKVEDGDTVYFDTIDPVWIFGYGKHKRKNWREYYRLVYNFAKVYPYAEASGRLQELVDSTIAANQMNRFQKDRYMTQVQTRLFKNFEGSIRNMTISQGALMLKLIDRETGQSSYSIIKDYKNASPPDSGRASPSSSTTTSRRNTTRRGPTRTSRNSSRPGRTGRSGKSTGPSSGKIRQWWKCLISKRSRSSPADLDRAVRRIEADP